MTVEFISADIHRSAYARVDAVMAFGSDELALAVCYCTEAGARLLTRHASRLCNSVDCFAIVSNEDINDFEALDRINRQHLNGHLFLHLGGTAPREGKLTPLMHSKVVYARRGNECQLWVGSHNLTRNGLSANIEAATLISGHANEQVFQDARNHLHEIRSEAVVFTPPPKVPPPPFSVDLLTIHAECSASAIAAPSAASPLYVSLTLNTTSCDGLLTGFPRTRLFLYAPGALRGSQWMHATPTCLMDGQLTGINGARANTRVSGTEAAWAQASLHMDNAEGPPVLRNKLFPKHQAVTQALFSLTATSGPDARIYLLGGGAPTWEEVEGLPIPITHPESAASLIHTGDLAINVFSQTEHAEVPINLPRTYTPRVGLNVGREIKDRFLRPEELANLRAWFERHGWTLYNSSTPIEARHGLLESAVDLAPFIRRTTHAYNLASFSTS